MQMQVERLGLLQCLSRLVVEDRDSSNMSGMPRVQTLAVSRDITCLAGGHLAMHGLQTSECSPNVTERGHGPASS